MPIIAPRIIAPIVLLRCCCCAGALGRVCVCAGGLAVVDAAREGGVPGGVVVVGMVLVVE
jgi:hypothetical protein